MPAQATPWSKKNFRELRGRLTKLPTAIEATQSAITEAEKRIEFLKRVFSGKFNDAQRSILIGEQRKALDDLSERRNKLDSLQIDQKNVRHQLEVAHASFARSELVKFCQSHRNRLNPRRVANAVAGLPFLSWRQSAMRCVKLEIDKAPGRFRYQTFRIVLRIIKAWERKVTTWDGSADLVTHAQKYLQRSRNAPIHVFSDLCKEFRFLRLSMQELLKEEQALKEQFEPGERACRITSKYFRLNGLARSESDTFWAERESIKRGKIRKK
jgi:hypothetical protein